jgi:hypothetical protein
VRIGDLRQFNIDEARRTGATVATVIVSPGAGGVSTMRRRRRNTIGQSPHM